MDCKQLEPEIQPLPTIDDLAKSLSEKDAKHLSTLGVGSDEAEDLSKLFPREIPSKLVEQHNTKSRLAEFLKIPQKLQKWRKRK